VEPNASPTSTPESATPEPADATATASEPSESPATESEDAATGADPALADSTILDETPIPGETAVAASDSLTPGIPNGAEILEPALLDQNPYGILALWDQGDLVIKGVAVVLLLMSIVSWYLIVNRGLRALRLRRAARGSARFWHAESLEEGLDLLGPNHRRANPFRHLVEEGIHARDHHLARRQELHGQLSLAEWLTICLRTTIDESAERMQSGLAILASVGSTAPFIGLFGTVWGIYHALVSIGVSGQASIDKVAGPVGEALIMTAFGLAVAIPAVLGYNLLIRANKGVLGQLNRFAHQLHSYFLTGTPVNRPALRVARIVKEAS
jgi:biopolymer transport protein ExbB